MKRFLLSVMAGAILASCSAPGLGPSVGRAGVQAEPSAIRAHTASGFRTLYRFPGGAHGLPVGGLVYLNGSYYGVGASGGGKCNCGFVFGIAPGGTVHVIHTFSGGADGGKAQGRLAIIGNTLYGVTKIGGDLNCPGFKVGCGVVFSVTPSGSFHVLHAFEAGSDGKFPAFDLSAVNGTLWGATERAIFSISTTGNLRAYNVGGAPNGDFISAGGKIWGTTLAGGANGHGSIYTIDGSGHITTIYSLELTRFRGYFPSYGERIHHGKASHVSAGVPA